MSHDVSITRCVRVMAVILLALTLAGSTLHARIYVVQFGGGLGYNYSPASFSVSVGDTVRWQGNFVTHPLSSGAIPVGAPIWHNESGVSFDYAITVAGTYEYQCDVHGPSMGGSFSANVTSIGERSAGPVPGVFVLGQNFPNPFNPSTTIQYGLPVRSSVRLTICNLLGQAVQELVSGEQQSGFQSVVWNANVASGIYFCRMEASSVADPRQQFVQTRRLLLLR